MQLPRVEYALCCDHASIDMDGKLNMNGIFDGINFKEFPAVHPVLFIASKILLPQGKHRITLTLMQEDAVLAKAQMDKESEKDLIVHHHLWRIQNLKLDSPTPLELHVLVDGKEIFIRYIQLALHKERV